MSDDAKSQAETPRDPKPAEPTAPPQDAAAAGQSPSSASGPAPADKSSGLFRGRDSARQPETPPAPPPRRKRRDGALSAMSGALSFVLLLFVAGAFALIAGSHKLKEPGPLSADKIVLLPPRSDAREILDQLDREGVIDNQLLMNIALLVEGARGKVKPGEYLFKQHASLREVMDELVNGRQLLHGVTIPEGLTSEQILLRLRDNDVLAGEVIDPPKEGSLLPETYKVARGYPRSKLIQKMQEDQRKLVDQIWTRRARDLPIKTPYELITLASIVEKETGKTEERPRVAAVFVNRLRKGMRLQSDPTIVYGLVGGKATLGRGISRAEIDRWTPYNTYAIDGLPPGPIANPGRAALEAAANPASTSDLYFVADGTGGHVFADSLDQHSRNVQRWRQIEHDQKDKAGGDDHATPGAAPAPPPAPAVGREKRSEISPIGRLLALGREEDEFPKGRACAPDAGAGLRLGRFAPADAMFLIGDVDDPSRAAARAEADIAPARAFFIADSSQWRATETSMDALAFAPGAGVVAEEGEEAAVLARAPESADGRAIAAASGAEIASYPVSPKLRAEQKARAARLGLSVGSDQLPADVLDKTSAPPEPDPHAAAPAGTEAAPQPRRRAIDASVGTALDPLRDRGWDLTSAKTVPSGVTSFR